MREYFRSMTSSQNSCASVPLVFLSFSIIVTFQFIISIFISKGFVSSGLLINEIIVVAGLPVFLISIFDFNRQKMIPLPMPDVKTVFLVLIMVLGAVVMIDYLTAASEHFFPLPQKYKDAFVKLIAAKSLAGVIWKTFLLCVLPAICEEIYFRGFCQTSLAAKWGNNKAIFVTSLLFAALHGNPWYFHLYFLLGVLFGAIYATTGSLWMAIFAHFLNNAWTFLTNVFNFHLPLTKSFTPNDAIILILAITIFTITCISLQTPDT